MSKAAPADTGRTPRRRSAALPGHLAVLDGRAGTPTPTERVALYLATLRRGEPPHGWIVARAREWDMAHSIVARELEEARSQLAASRTPDAAQVLAHELIVQSVEEANEIRADAAECEDPTERGRLRAEAAKLKLKAAAELRQLYKKPGSMVLVQGQQGPGGLGGLR